MTTKSAKQLLKQYLEEGRVMQLATVSGNQPWICSVYYVFYENYLYWLSLPSRRHSQDIVKNANVAVALAIKHDKPVIGVQAAGIVDEVSDANEVRAVMERYVAKYGEGKDYYKNFTQGTVQHRMYRFAPHQYVLFDEVHFAHDARQEFTEL